MTLDELKQAVDVAVANCRLGHADPSQIKVCIPTYKVGSLGRAPHTDVSSARMGFDHESNSFLIDPVETLREIDYNEAETIRRKYEELGWSLHRAYQLERENEHLKQLLTAGHP